MKLRLTESCPKTITCVVFLVFFKKKNDKNNKISLGYYLGYTK